MTRQDVLITVLLAFQAGMGAIIAQASDLGVGERVALWLSVANVVSGIVLNQLRGLGK